ncbi:eCIS core domain-containing protein [Luteibacter aegosomatissinici]|uniref:eCIS core domain-containing protein n=1 Tax=Luteibacter aegosomatissinici TaxID=2911539 RepID=UPI001FF83C40|nr:DUF4157 domain-containing protein [Luteibacter aegosomatissinici]UPG96339.1 DUF4157 domain-containing protein [Luteibacter aegosomatissinici]
MTHRAFAANTLLFALLTVSGGASADFWSDAKRTLGDAGTVVYQGTVAPTQVVVNAAQAAVGQKSSSDILAPLQQVASSTGDLVEGGASLARQPQQYLYNRAQRYAQKWVGDSGAFIFDVATFSTELNTDLASATAGGAANALRGQNPLQIAAAPLAAALQAARDQHYSRSKPIPDSVKLAFRGLIDESTLGRARYAVGQIEITLPNLIGRSNRFMGADYAVTVGDTIVFNREPPDVSEEPEWWAHELTHVKQYGDWGIERFAWEYIRDGGNAVEGQARSNASQVASAYESRSSDDGTGTLALASQSALPVPSNGPDMSVSPQVYTQQVRIVAQAFFADGSGLPNSPIQFLINSQGFIFVRNIYTGEWFQVGWAVAPPQPNHGEAWVYQTRFVAYAVMPDGRILFPDQGWIQIGFVRQV